MHYICNNVCLFCMLDSIFSGGGSVPDSAECQQREKKSLGLVSAGTQGPGATSKGPLYWLVLG